MNDVMLEALPVVYKAHLMIHDVVQAFLVCKYLYAYLNSKQFLSTTRFTRLDNATADALCENSHQRLLLALRVESVFLGVIHSTTGCGSSEFKPLMKILPNNYCCFRELVNNGKLIYLEDQFPPLKISVYFEKYFGPFARDLIEAERVDPYMFSITSSYVTKTIRKMLQDFWAFFGLEEPELETFRELAELRLENICFVTLRDFYCTKDNWQNILAIQSN